MLTKAKAEFGSSCIILCCHVTLLPQVLTCLSLDVNEKAVLLGSYTGEGHCMNGSNSEVWKKEVRDQIGPSPTVRT